MDTVTCIPRPPRPSMLAWHRHMDACQRCREAVGELIEPDVCPHCQETYPPHRCRTYCADGLILWRAAVVEEFPEITRKT